MGCQCRVSMSGHTFSNQALQEQVVVTGFLSGFRLHGKTRPRSDLSFLSFLRFLVSCEVARKLSFPNQNKNMVAARNSNHSKHQPITWRSVFFVEGVKLPSHPWRSLVKMCSLNQINAKNSTISNDFLLIRWFYSLIHCKGRLNT